jgi:uncharacterized protein (TIGR03435 family)
MKSPCRLKWLLGAFSAASLALVAAKPFPLRAQEAPSNTASAKAPLAFEVATVKPVDPTKMVPIELRVYPGGRLIIHGHDLRTLVSEAFAFPGWQVVGGEKWANERRFDIEGKPPEEFRNSIPGGEFAWFGIQDAQARAMLQALIIERFHLKYHIEKQPGTVYLLKRSNGPLRLEHMETNLYKHADDGRVSPSSAYPTGDIGLVSGKPVGLHQTSMLQLARALSADQHAPVTDETELPGFYNFKSATVVTDEDFKAGGMMHLFTEALPEMGLKLVKTQGMVEKLVIDSAELPAAN